MRIFVKVNNAILLTLIFLFILGCENPSDSEGAKTELEGTWMGYEKGRSTGTWTFIVKGSNIEINGRGGAEWYKGTISIYSSSIPKKIDSKINECFYPTANGKTALGIYKIEGKILTFAGNEPGTNKRPTSFTAGSGTRVYVLTKQ